MATGEEKKGKFIAGFFKILLLLFSISLIIILVISFSFYYYYSKHLPEIPPFNEIEFGGVSVIRSGEGVVLGEVYEEKRYIAPLSEIPPLLVKAFLASEDERFFKHKGLDFQGILRAMWSNLTAGEIREGGSTITQQIAKTFVGKEKSLKRKIREAILARRIEKQYTKEQILHLYMNIIYLGHNSYGVKSAAWNYFRKDLKDLSLAEIAIIASLPQAPGKINPYKNFSESTKAMKRVLQRMVENGFISMEEKESALKEEVIVYPLLDNFGERAPLIAQEGKEEVLKILGFEENEKGVLGEKNLSCETSLELGLQLEAEKVLLNALMNLQKRQGYKGALKRLKKEEDVKKILKKAEEFYKEKYGSFFLKENEIYLGIITEVNKKELKIKVSESVEGKIPYKYLKWVHHYSEFPRFDYQVSNENGSLFVQVFDEKGNEIKRKTHFKDGFGGISIENVKNLKDGEKIKFSRWKEGKKVSFDGKLKDAKEFFSPGDVLLVRFIKNEGENIFSLETMPDVEGSVLSIQPQTEYVKVMVGSSDFAKNQFNHAKTLRQTGSVIKPIYYSMIYDMGIPPSSVFSGSPFRKENYEPVGKKEVEDKALWEALTMSENAISLRVFNYILNNAGKEAYIEWMKKFGLDKNVHGYIAEALGVDEELFDMVKAFGVFANRGYQTDGIIIKYVEDGDGNIIYDRRSIIDANLKISENLKVIYDSLFKEKKRIISREVQYLISSNLREVINKGTGKKAKELNAAVQGKTGTLPYDVWFVGWSGDMVTGVWVGEAMRQRYLGRDKDKSGVYGGNTALAIWVDFMKIAIEGKEIYDDLLDVPENIIIVNIDPQTGLLGRNENEGIKIPHIKGTEPTEYAPLKEGVEFYDFNQMEF